jgi:hypothetical protein
MSLADVKKATYYAAKKMGLKHITQALEGLQHIDTHGGKKR